MKVICLSTLDKFSRFYLDIERQLKVKSDNDVDLKIYSLHLSGFLYTFSRFKHSSLISLKAWFLAYRKKRFYTSIINSKTKYKNLIFNDYIVFHKALNKNISEKALQLQTLAYIDIFDTIFNKEQPDYLISIGDSRLCIEIAIALSKRKNIKVLYIEQGPFNTTFFDKNGVNANISIRERANALNIDNSEVNNDNIHVPNTKKYNRSPIYRGLDMFFMTVFERTKSYPPDLKYNDLNSYRPKRYFTKTEYSHHKQIALLILQIPLDVNMIYHSPYFKTHTEIIASVYSNLPKDAKLVVREHPLYVGKYETSFYDFVKENDILIENNSSLNEALDISKIVIVNNSTVGVEAIFKYKPVVVLGNAFYDNDEICLKLKDKNDLKMLLEKAIDYNPKKEQIDNFKQLLFNTVLIEGAITDCNLKSTKYIANYIIANS